eukprot:4241079-Prymnesium_polylepis.1
MSRCEWSEAAKPWAQVFNALHPFHHMRSASSTNSFLETGFVVRSRLDPRSAERTTKPDLDRSGRTARPRRPEPRPSADLGHFCDKTSRQISTTYGWTTSVAPQQTPPNGAVHMALAVEENAPTTPTNSNKLHEGNAPSACHRRLNRHRSEHGSSGRQYRWTSAHPRRRRHSSIGLGAKTSLTACLRARAPTQYSSSTLLAR